MARPVTLFTGQWADLDIRTMCEKAVSFGYDGLELACWGDHFEVDKADDEYCQARRGLLEEHGLQLFSVSAHLVGQAVCDNIDGRHEAILPPHVWGDGDPEGVRERAAAELIASAHAASRLGVDVVNGFTGSPIWHLLYSFADGEFDTVILDDVLGAAERPMTAIFEARRVLKTSGRLLVLCQAETEQLDAIARQLAIWCGSAGLRLAPPRRIPANDPHWLLGVATYADAESEVA